MTKNLPNAPLAMLVAATAFVAGCGERPEIAPFGGRVLLEGKPLAFGSVMLQPIDGGEPSRGQIQPDGTFTMAIRGVGDGACVGTNRVRVTCFEGQQGGGSVAKDGELMLGRSLIPAKYNNFGSSGLTVDVLPEENEPYVIELQTR